MVTVVVFYVDHFIYAFVLHCLGPKVLLGVLTVTNNTFALNIVFLRSV